MNCIRTRFSWRKTLLKEVVKEVVKRHRRTVKRKSKSLCNKVFKVKPI